MSDEQRLIPEFLSPYLTQEQYDRAREYLKTPHTRVDLSLGEWDDLINGRGWPKGSLVMCKDSYQIAHETKQPSDQETEETK